MRKKIKTRVMTFILSVALLLGVFPISAVAVAAEYKTITTEEILNKMNDYINYLGLSDRCVWYWNANLRDSNGQTKLLNALLEYEKTGNKELLKVGLTTNPCPKTAKTGQHRYEYGGCTSNIFNDGSYDTAQCHGFGNFYAFYIFAHRVNDGGFTKWTKKNTTWEALGGLKPGDFLRVNGHTMIFHSVDATGLIKVVHANGHSSSKPCSLNFENPWYTNNTKYSEAIVRQLFENGGLTITRYNYIVDCNHEYEFKDDSMFCVFCNEEYPLSFTPVNAYMNVVAVNKTSGSAPAHRNPYGNSEITRRYYVSDKVYVTSYCYNAYNNKWYKLSTGEYVNGDYLGVSTSVGYVNISWDTLALNDKPASSASGKSKMLAELEPYTRVKIYPAESTGSWYYVTAELNGRSVTGYVYKKYITVLETVKEIGTNVTYTANTGTNTIPTTLVATPTPTPTPAPKAKVLAPTETKYKQKYYVSNNNAVLVTNIQKDRGSNVTECGISLYDKWGNLIKSYSENVIGIVGANNTNFHTWFDVKKELKVNLSSKTTYSYQFYSVVDGVRYEGQMYSFTTK